MRATEFITERKKKRSKKTKLGRYFFPGFAYYGGYGGEGDAGGGDGGGGESMYEENKHTSDEVQKFVNWAVKKLHIKKPPKIDLSYNTKEAQKGHHTGRHTEGDNKVWIYAKNRNLVDILRTLFHELVHVRQSELNMIKPGDSYPGSPIERQADEMAGKFIKIFGEKHPEIFQ